MFYKKVPDTEQHSHADAADEHAPENWIRRRSQDFKEPLESRQLLMILRLFLGKMDSLSLFCLMCRANLGYR
jgi:hypothetical protein